MVGEKSVASALPIIRWRGWRPLLLDMTSDEQGGQVFLVFGREGDLALLPTATVTYVCYEPLGAGDRWDAAQHGIDPVSVSYSAAATDHAVWAAVRDLEADGWRVIGRLLATFHGVDTEDDFWERVDCADGDRVTR
jgi:hypothetical protein